MQTILIYIGVGITCNNTFFSISVTLSWGFILIWTSYFKRIYKCCPKLYSKIKAWSLFYLLIYWFEQRIWWTSIYICVAIKFKWISETIIQQQMIQKERCRQDSNLCGQSPMDFKSISLTTRTPQHGIRRETQYKWNHLHS